MVWLKQSKFISMCTHRGLKERQFIAHYPLALSTFKPQSLLRDYQGVLSLNYLISSELPFELCQSIKLIGILSNKKSCSKAVYRPLSSPAAIVLAYNVDLWTCRHAECPKWCQIIIRDVGSTTLYAACTVDTVYTFQNAKYWMGWTGLGGWIPQYTVITTRAPSVLIKDVSVFNQSQKN